MDNKLTDLFRRMPMPGKGTISDSIYRELLKKKISETE